MNKQPINQDFIPEDWERSFVGDEKSPYYGTPIYLNPANNKAHKAFLSPSAYHLLCQYPQMMDYREMTNIVINMGLAIDNDYEAFIAGQVLSVKTLNENVEQKNNLIDYMADAKSYKNTTNQFREYYENSQRELAEERLKLKDPANQPEFVKELLKEQNDRAELQREKNDLQNQVNELKQENTRLKTDIEGWKQFKKDVEAGRVGHYIDEFNQKKEELTREKETAVNDLNIKHAKEVNDLNNQIHNLNKQVNSLTLQVEQLQNTSKNKMDEFLERHKLKCVTNAADIATTKKELLTFIDGILGVFDNAIDSINEIATAVKKTNIDVLNITQGVLNIMPLFEKIKTPRFDLAKEETEKLKDKIENKYKVEEQYLKDFIDKGQLPDIRLDEDKQK